MKHPRNVAEVGEVGLCTACGTCAGVCPQGAVNMRTNAAGLPVPHVDPNRCTSCGLCLRACPGWMLSLGALRDELHGGESMDATLGPYRAIHAACAADRDLRSATQSGGVVSALLISLMEAGRIDAAVVTRWRRSCPLEAETIVATTPEEVLSAAMSKYVPVPACAAIAAILGVSGRYAVVGTACQIHGYRKAGALLPDLQERIVLHIGLHCLGVFSAHYPADACRRWGFAPEDVRSFEFRSKRPWGWPGHLAIEDSRGHRRCIPGPYSRLAPRPYYTPYRCRMCFDKLNELSDISVGDCRVARHYGVRKLADSYGPDNAGRSDVVVRTEAGERALACALACGRLSVELTEPGELARTALPAEKKLGAHLYAVLKKLAGGAVPRYDVRYVPADRRVRWALRLGMPVSTLAGAFLGLCSRMLHSRSCREFILRVPPGALRAVSAVLGRLAPGGLVPGGRVREVRTEQDRSSADAV